MAKGIGLVYTASEAQAAAPLDIERNRIGTMRIDLSVARTNEEINIAGNFLWCVSASTTGELAQFDFGEYTGSNGMPLGQGLKISGVPYSKFLLTNAAQPGAYVLLVYGIEGVPGSINIDNLVTLASTVGVTKSGNISTIGDVTTVAAVSTQFLAGSATRRSAIVKADSGNAGPVRIGDSNVGAARGINLQPGESISIDTTAALYYYDGAGGNKLQVLTRDD